MNLLSPEIIADVENEGHGIDHGVIYLQLHIRDSKVHFYRTNREKSKVMENKSEGIPPNSIQGKTNKNARQKNELGV